ncbi:MAG: hypothetical protein A2V66_11170 [Ignavibacteria bacterium RBG_13_36_8]|nr:MAG: hypothetical protein A2V66_11170 [Ignavibacteria bacterium RBG_13_36_8]
MCKLITTFFAAIFLLSSLSFAQWIEKTNGLPTWGVALAIDACDANTAIISVRTDSGSRQVLFKSTDAGDSWTELVWPTNDYWEEAEDICMIDNDHMWFGTDNGRIYSTTDGGATWQLQFYDQSKTTFINYIEMFDLNNGVAMGDAINFGSLNSIHFISTNVGWTVGREHSNNSSSTSNTILKTTDGGSNWISQITPNDRQLNSVYFFDENIGWAAGPSGLIFKTVDGGNTWVTQTTPMYGYFNRSDYYKEIHFINESTGWAVGDLQGTIIKTTNGGDEWLDITKDLNFYFTTVNFIDQNSGCVAGYDKSYINGVILKTDDGGSEWREVFSEPDYIFNSIQFTDSNDGWAAGYNREENLGIIIKSEDGGESWTSKTFNEYYQFNSIYSIKYNIGFGIPIHRVWAVGDNGIILVSSDGGETWTVQESGVPNSLKSIHFSNFFNGWICGDNGLILKTSDSGATWNKVYGETYKPALFLQTTDGGTNWIETNTNSLLNYYSGDMWRRIDFTDMNTGFFWYGGNRKGFYRTTDGGISWTHFNFSDYVTVLKFYNENLGIAYNLDERTISRTTDGGNTWTNTATIANDWGQDIEFIPGNSDLVWFVGANTYFSQDGGTTWSLELNVRGRDIVFVDEIHGWLLCDNRNVYYTSNNGGIVTDIDINKNEIIPSELLLFQNYPNPFNPRTIISYQLAEASNITLKVYDLLGNEVATLVDEEKSPGTYEVEFNAENFSSGIYFYTLQAGKFRETKKFVLLK